MPHSRSRPGPGSECRFERFIAAVGVEIAWSAPRKPRRLPFNADAGQRRDRAPQVTSYALEFERVQVETFAVEPHAAFKATRPRGAGLVDPNVETHAVPGNMAASQCKRFGGTAQRFASALRHRPAFRFAVESDIDRAMVFGVTPAAPRVVGREHAADKGDDRQAGPPVITERVDVPPGIAAGNDDLVEARSEISASAACRPDSAAIGTPGPGCTLPPAR
jgi:hypothetical protein